jgi:S-DNA-T family DNA segregation ATPase FtsK/SpoIIIE
MSEPFIDIINKLGLWGTLAWLLLAYAALHALIQGRWPIPGEALLRLLWRERMDNRSLSSDYPASWPASDYAAEELVDVESSSQLPASSDAIKYLSRQATHLERLLHSFGIAAIVRNAEPGPVITLFEIELGLGVSGKELNTRSNDIARILQVDQVRVIENLPGRTAAGIEVPNRKRESVYLNRLTHSLKGTGPLSVVLGVNTAGDPVAGDLAVMPHLLIAGTTGSGKSVCVNAMLACLLERNSPRQLRLILIDPKALEFSLYEGIPHLLCPVVTDMRQASRALAWCVDEMERRYAAMAALRVRHIEAYNQKMHDLQRFNEQLPCVVVVIDELADLMLTHNKVVEPLIQRLAQKSRAAGIHLILATQRPTINVVSGTIKTNIRSRLTLALPSQTDSRTVLDQIGAEKLLDKGDALWMSHHGIQRIHCPFISDDEIGILAERLKSEVAGEVEYVDMLVNDAKTTVIDLMPKISRDDSDIDESESDDDQHSLYADAVQLVIEEQKVTKVLLKQELGINDRKAEQLLSQMETEHIISASKGRSRRRVLLKELPDLSVTT